MTFSGTAVSNADRVALEALSLLSKKWHPVVLLVLGERDPSGFNEMLEAIPDVSGKVLSGALEDLCRAGLVDRTVVSESPLRVEYGLTDAGRDMGPVFDALADWGECHLGAGSSTPLADGDSRRAETVE